MKSFSKTPSPTRRAALGILQGVSPVKSLSLPQRLQLAPKAK